MAYTGREICGNTDYLQHIYALKLFVGTFQACFMVLSNKIQGKLQTTADNKIPDMNIFGFIRGNLTGRL